MGSREHAFSFVEETSLRELFENLPAVVKIPTLIAFRAEEFSVLLPLLANEQDKRVFKAVVSQRLRDEIACLKQPAVSRNIYPPAIRKEKMTLDDLRRYTLVREDELISAALENQVRGRIFVYQDKLADLFGLADEPMEHFSSPKAVSKETAISVLQKLLGTIPASVNS